jgi:CheY-like chemotaxis protein
MHKKSVLLVDDNVQIRRKVRKFLLEHSVHFEVYEASDGLDAIGKATETQPDLIILDWSMPRMNGVDAAQHLRKVGIEAPIILFTMHAPTLPVTALRSVGVNAVVMKPDLAILNEQIEKLLAV